MKRKYGEDRISQVVTYGTIKTKQALKDSARILGKDFKVGEQLTKALPPAIMGKDIRSTASSMRRTSATPRPRSSASSTREPRHARSSSTRSAEGLTASGACTRARSS